MYFIATPDLLIYYHSSSRFNHSFALTLINDSKSLGQVTPKGHAVGYCQFRIWVVKLNCSFCKCFQVINILWAVVVVICDFSLVSHVVNIPKHNQPTSLYTSQVGGLAKNPFVCGCTDMYCVRFYFHSCHDGRGVFDLFNNVDLIVWDWGLDPIWESTGNDNDVCVCLYRSLYKCVCVQFVSVCETKATVAWKALKSRENPSSLCLSQHWLNHQTQPVGWTCDWLHVTCILPTSCELCELC